MAFQMHAHFVALAHSVQDSRELLGKVGDALHDALHGIHPAFYETAAAAKTAGYREMGELYKKIFHDPDSPEGQKLEREYHERHKAWLAEQKAATVEPRDGKAQAALARLAAAHRGL